MKLRLFLIENRKVNSTTYLNVTTEVKFCLHLSHEWKYLFYMCFHHYELSIAFDLGSTFYSFKVPWLPSYVCLVYIICGWGLNAFLYLINVWIRLENVKIIF